MRRLVNTTFPCLGLSLTMLVSIMPRGLKAAEANRARTQVPNTVRIMTLNLCEEGPARGIKGAKKWAALIRESKADIVGLQEIYDYIKTPGADHTGEIGDPTFIQELTKELKWNKLNEDDKNNTCVLTRFPTRAKQVVLPSGKQITPISVHLTDTPYQVCQLYKCNYDGSPPVSSGKAAEASASSTRTQALASLLRSYDKATLADAIIMGDFNEPSHLDWTPRAEEKGLYLFSVAWPTTRLLESLGLHDAYRIKHSDEVRHPGHTYPSPKWKEKFGIPTRIDYIFSSFKSVVNAGLFVKEQWPSDHLGVWVDLSFPSNGSMK